MTGRIIKPRTSKDTTFCCQCVFRMLPPVLIVFKWKETSDNLAYFLIPCPSPPLNKVYLKSRYFVQYTKEEFVNL